MIRETQMALVAAVVVGCGTPPATDAGPDGGMDGGTDAGLDAGLDGSTDAPTDAGSDAAVWVGEGCNIDRGLECDGDWSGRCAEPCGSSACCSPINGEFVCAPRAADGACPAPDLFFDATQVDERYRFTWRYFEPDACSVEEACIGAPGWRRLLRFASWTPNIGDADVYLGNPDDSPDFFGYSMCHAHFHFESYARYSLRDASGALVATGHKQAFCLVDTISYPGGDTRGLYYTCENQGIQRGYLDIYGDYLDCQWVDVTDVPPGDYSLHVELNYEGLVLESDYSNNTADVAITVPASDVTRACPARATPGPDRNCGLERAGTYPCTPGERLEVACSSICGLGSCTGDAFLRVCDVGDDPNCDSGLALADNDNSYCDMVVCGLGGDCCPRAQAVCPTSGEIVVYTGAWDPRAAHTCDVVVRPAP